MSRGERVKGQDRGHIGPRLGLSVHSFLQVVFEHISTAFGSKDVEMRKDAP